MTFFYYLLDFDYTGPKCGIHPTEETQTLLCKAEKVVNEKIKVAQDKGIEIIHAYSWPDGSLYKYARTSEKRELPFFREIFDTKTVRLAKVHEEETPQKMTGGCEYVTLEEKFSLTREELHQLYWKRLAERDVFYKPYHDARQKCQAGCNAPGLACDACHKFYEQAEKLENAWRGEDIKK